MGSAVSVNRVQNFLMEIVYSRLCDSDAFFNRHFPKCAHDGRYIDCHRAGSGAGVASHAKPDVRALKRLGLQTILNQSNDAIGPIGHGMGHGTTASTALAMKTPPEVLSGSTNNRFTKIDVWLRRRILVCIGWIRLHGDNNYHKPQQPRIDLSQTLISGTWHPGKPEPNTDAFFKERKCVLR